MLMILNDACRSLTINTLHLGYQQTEIDPLVYHYDILRDRFLLVDLFQYGYFITKIVDFHPIATIIWDISYQCYYQFYSFFPPNTIIQDSAFIRDTIVAMIVQPLVLQFQILLIAMMVSMTKNQDRSGVKMQTAYCTTTIFLKLIAISGVDSEIFERIMMYRYIHVTSDLSYLYIA